MLGFKNDYKNVETVLLNINYRSTKNIVQGAGKVVKNNQNRFQKEITTINEEGVPIQVKIFSKLVEENLKVVKEILAYQKQGISLSNMAVLFRTNTQPRALIEKLMEYNIPFRMKDSIPNIYEHWIARNIISYIKIGMGSRERGEFLQIANRPKRYLGRDCFKEPIVQFNELIQYYMDKYWMQEKINKMEYDIIALKSMTPYAAIQYIRKGIGYEEYLNEYAKFRRINIEELIDILDELQEVSRPFSSYEEWFAHIEEYAIELKEQMQKKYDKDVDSVCMATMHSSKGLEYEVVFIIDANEGITPHRKSVIDADIEEERRMFYVAMTRAKQYLHIYAVKERYNKTLTLSRFVAEYLLDKEELKEGTKVMHKTYGFGIIKSNKDGKLVVYFDKIKKNRILDLSFCVHNQLLNIVRDVR